MGGALRPDGSRSTAINPAHIFGLPMPRTHSRSSSPAANDSKRRKTSHSPTPPLHFADGLFSPDHVARLNADYKTNSPFKYAVLDRLFQNDLLENVKDECLRELSFTTKETDIYKVDISLALQSFHLIRYRHSGQPNGRPRLPQLPHPSPSQPSTKSPRPPRCTLLCRIQTLPPVRHGLWSSVRHKAGHVRQFIYEGMPFAEPRRRHWYTPRFIYFIHAPSKLSDVATRLGWRPRTLPRQA